jgi:hypothetical protein
MLMGLQVIGAGYPRTGTLSLKLALELLGFGPCHHMAEFFTRPGLTELWSRGLGEEPIDWERLLDGYRSCTDAPCCFFYQELAARYPEAKVILSIRSPESWWKSASATVMAGSPPGPVTPVIAATSEVQRRRGSGGLDPRNPDPEAAVAAFNRHNDEVRQAIDPARLLVFEAKEGWDPLCAFLGVPVPDAPYPRVNTSEEFQGNVDRAVSGDPASFTVR